MSGGVGGVTGAIPLPRPDPGFNPPAFSRWLLSIGNTWIPPCNNHQCDAPLDLHLEYNLHISLAL